MDMSSNIASAIFYRLKVIRLVGMSSRYYYFLLMQLQILTLLLCCTGVTCSPGFSNPSNGYVKCSDLSNFGSECTFECNHGFMLEGKARTVCGKQGWSITVAPSCKSKS